MIFDSSWRTEAEANARARYRFLHGNPWGLNDLDTYEIEESARNGLLRMSCEPPDSSCWSVGVTPDRAYDGDGPAADESDY